MAQAGDDNDDPPTKTTEVVHHPGGNVLEIQKEWIVDGKRHRDGDKPALRKFDGHGAVTKESWYAHGERHRDGDKPAICEYDAATGTLMRESWHVGGLDHRADDKPAFIRYHCSNGNLATEIWYFEGKIYSNEDHPSFHFFDEVTGNVNHKEWWEDDHAHRIGAPAIIEYDPVTGAVTDEDWVVHGRDVPPGVTSATYDYDLPPPRHASPSNTPKKAQDDEGPDTCEKWLNQEYDTKTLQRSIAYYQNTDVVRNIRFDHKRFMHRNDGLPAWVHFDTTGVIAHRAWFVNSQRHREDDRPACVGYDLTTGAVTYEEWYVGGKQHREGGLPAKIEYDPTTGAVISEAWFFDDYRTPGPTPDTT